MSMAHRAHLGLLALFSAGMAYGQTCTITMVQGTNVTMFGDGSAGTLLRQPDGSYTFESFLFNTSFTAPFVGASVLKTPHYEKTIAQCSGNSARIFKLPTGWKAFADLTGIAGANPAAGDLFGTGAPAGIGIGDNNREKADLILGSLDGTILSQSNLATPNQATSFLIGDYNRDGKKDLAVLKFGSGGADVASSGSGAAIFLGNNDGTFKTPVVYPIVSQLQLGASYDFDNDGKLDIAGLGYSGVAGVITGNGDGSFRANLPFTVGRGVNDNYLGIAAGDVNGDGKGDVIVSAGSFNPGAGGKIYVLTGKGDGTFNASKIVSFGGLPGALAVGDFNKDGKLDLIVNDGNSITVMTGDNTGNFTTLNRYESVSGSPMVTDVDGDGNLDVVVGAGHPDGITPNVDGLAVTILFGNGDGTLGGAPRLSTGQTPNGIAIGDFDGDGKVDIAVSATDSKEIWILKNKGAGVYSTFASVTIPSATPHNVVAGDINGDGKADLVAVDGSTVYVMVGNGNGFFTSVVPYAVGGSANAVVLGDFNGDKKLDIAATSSGSAAGVTVLTGNGDGTFAVGSKAAAGTAPTAIFAGDFNKDGKLDVAVTDGAGVQVLIGNGTGGFAAPVRNAIDGAAISLAGGDINGDGAIDLIAGSGTTTTVSYVGLLVGNGNGTFKTVTSLYSNAPPQAIAVGDMNGDGKLDVVVGQCCGDTSVIYYVGRGDGTFADSATLGPLGISTRAIAVADLNGDGKADLVTADSTQYGLTGFTNILLNSTVASANPITTINAATLLPGNVAPDSFVAAKGTALASGAGAAGVIAPPPTTSYPTILGGTTVKVKDSAGVERLAPLYYVSATQINYVLPVGTASGSATVTINAADGTISSGTITVAPVAPGLIMFQGTTIAAANVIRVRNSVQTGEDVYSVVNGTTIVAAPIDMGPATDTVVVLLYGTGFRNRTSLANVVVTVGGIPIVPDYAGAQSQYPALDQLNLILPRTLVGKGDVVIQMTVDGIAANPVHLTIK